MKINRNDVNNFFIWYEEKLTYLLEYYNCTIQYPKDMHDYDSFTDGFIITFNKLNYKLFICNYCMHEIFLNRVNEMHIKELRRFIEDRIINDMKN